MPTKRSDTYHSALQLPVHECLVSSRTQPCGLLIPPDSIASYRLHSSDIQGSQLGLRVRVGVLFVGEIRHSWLTSHSHFSRGRMEAFSDVS